MKPNELPNVRRVPRHKSRASAASSDNSSYFVTNNE
jgi:hypothetical protein